MDNLLTIIPPEVMVGVASYLDRGSLCQYSCAITILYCEGSIGSDDFGAFNSAVAGGHDEGGKTKALIKKPGTATQRRGLTWMHMDYQVFNGVHRPATRMHMDYPVFNGVHRPATTGIEGMQHFLPQPFMPLHIASHGNLRRSLLPVPSVFFYDPTFSGPQRVISVGYYQGFVHMMEREQGVYEDVDGNSLTREPCWWNLMVEDDVDPRSVFYNDTPQVSMGARAHALLLRWYLQELASNDMVGHMRETLPNYEMQNKRGGGHEG
jgi:hypothetical protein